MFIASYRLHNDKYKKHSTHKNGVNRAWCANSTILYLTFPNYQDYALIIFLYFLIEYIIHACPPDKAYRSARNESFIGGNKKKKKDYLKGWMVLHCQQIAQLYLTSISLLQSIHINGICRSRAFACLTTRSISFMALKSIFFTSNTFFWW